MLTVVLAHNFSPRRNHIARDVSGVRVAAETCDHCTIFRRRNDLRDDLRRSLLHPDKTRARLQYGYSARFIYTRATARYHAPYLRSIDQDSSAGTFTEGALQLFLQLSRHRDSTPLLRAFQHTRHSHLALSSLVAGVCALNAHTI